MFGSIARAAWGTSQWGAILPSPGAVLSLDSVCSGDLDKIFNLDAVAALIDQESTVSLDGLVIGEAEAAFAIDAAPLALPPDIYAQLTTKPYVLAELELPAGPVAVATKYRSKLGRVFTPRLRKGGRILRTIGAGTDDLRLELDDTTTHAAVTFRDLFTADDPEGSIVRVWLGAVGATDAQHILVFEGKIQHVQGFSDTVCRIQVVRREQVEDVILGQLVDQATFPDAPPESISSMLPIVFGTLATHVGIVINTNAIGTADFNVFAADLTLPLVDATEFPSAGQVKIGGELIDYTGKSGNVLTGLTRGAGGTLPSDHARGAEVAETGPFQVQFASHALGFMRRFKMLVSNGNLGDPVPEPTTVDPITAIATWADGLPQIRDPDARPTYQRVHFKDVDPLNTATNPQFAARESTGYEAFKVSQVQPGSILSLLTNTDKLGQPGDISRVWLGVLVDPVSIAGIAAFAVVASKVFVLTPDDNVPEEIVRHDERTGDRIYDVPPPVIDVSSVAAVGYSLTPKVVVAAGLFQTETRAGLVVDENDSTFACYMFVGFGESIISGGGSIVYRWTEQDWLQAFPPGASVLEIEMRCVMGDLIVPITSPWRAALFLDGQTIAGTLLRCVTKQNGIEVGFIRGIETFTLDVTGTFDPFAAPIKDANGQIQNIWDRIEMVLAPVTGVSSGIWCAREVSIQGGVTPPLPTVTATQDVRNSVSNYFEVTDQLLVANGQKDWASFGDTNSLGRVTFQGLGGEPRIIETFWVVEYTPFVQASSRVPDVFADVSGLVPDGNPVEIARAVVQRAPPEGLGLPATRIDQASYMTASASLVADGVRADFALREQSSAVSILSVLAAQTDCRDTWENQAHRIVRLPRADVPLTVARNLSKGDYLKSGRGVSDKSISRNSVREVANRITANWRLYAPTGKTSRSEPFNDLPSQATNLGLREGILDLGLLQDDVAAQVVAQRKLERIRVPRWILVVDVPIYGVSYRAGDLVSSDDPEFPFQVGEITQVNLNTDRLKRTRIQIVVWFK